MRAEVRRDWTWADGYLNAVRSILESNALHMIKFEIAPEESDLKQATDMVIEVRGQATVALRLRRPYYDYRDLTLRAWRASGKETELHKIKQGFASFYLYGWTNFDGTIPEWMLVDLDRLRQSKLLDSLSIIRNRDQTTGFVSIPFQRLQQHDCIIASRIVQ